MRCFLTTALVLLLVLPAPATELKSVLDQLEQAAATTRTLSSEFTQEKHLSIFSEKLLSKGHFAYQNPDRLRWELRTPFASGFVLRGDVGERWNGLSKEKGVFSVQQDPVMGMIAQQLLAWARVDLDWLQKRYRMELLATSPIHLRLTPQDKGEASFIKYLEITFAVNLHYISTVLLQEQGGDKTLLRFERVALNNALAEDVFKAPEFE